MKTFLVCTPKHYLSFRVALVCNLRVLDMFLPFYRRDAENLYEFLSVCDFLL